VADFIPLANCVVGNAYLIRSRNLRVGVCRSTHPQNGGFIGIREKFDSLFLFTEFHRDTGSALGTVLTLEDLGPCPVRPLSEDLGTECRTCGGTFDTWEQYSAHKASGCSNPEGWRIPNTELFNWLATLEWVLSIGGT